MDGFSIHHSVQSPQCRSLSIGTRCCEARVVQSIRLNVDAGDPDVRERERDPRMVSVQIWLRGDGPTTKWQPLALPLLRVDEK